MEFRPNGEVVSSDGQLEQVKSWTAKRTDHGYLVRMKPISSRGAHNCQGLNAGYVVEQSLPEMLVVVENGGEMLRVYFGTEAKGNYMELRRRHDG